MTTFDVLYERLKELEVIDAHEHHRGSIECVATDPVSFICTNYLGGVLNSLDMYAMQNISKSSDDQSRYLALCDYWPMIKNTAHAKIVEGYFVQRGVNGGIIPENYEAIAYLCANRSPKWLKDAFKEHHIAATITNVVGHVNLGGFTSIEQFATGKLRFESGVHPIVGIDTLLQYSRAEEIERVEALANMSVNSPQNLASAVCKIAEMCVQNGAVGLKVLLAYTHGLEFAQPTASLLNEDWSLLREWKSPVMPGRTLQSYLLRSLIQFAGETGIPVAFHTGYLQSRASEQTNVKQLVNLFSEYPNVNFDVYHLSYPYYFDMLEAAKSYSNVYSNCCWTTAIDPAYTMRYLQNVALSLPAAQVIGFGADYILYPELAVECLNHSLKIIAGALAPLVEQRFFSLQEAEELAAWWLSGTAKRLYHL